MASIKIRAEIMQDGASRPLIQFYRLRERRMILLTYGANIPGQQEEMDGTDIGALFEHNGRVGFFPLSERMDPEMDIAGGKTIVCGDVTIRLIVGARGTDDRTKGRKKKGRV